VERVVLSGVNVLPFPYPRLMRLAGPLMLPLMKRDFFLRAQAKALRIPAERWEGYRRSARAMSPRAFLRIGNELMTFGLDPELEGVASPTLVLAGEGEQPLIRRSIPAVVGALRHAEGYLVPGVGHGWSGEAPDLFARTVAAWCAGEALPAGLKPVEA
jgi:pimeloyl-ACP methyl ester carboxylesterase